MSNVLIKNIYKNIQNKILKNSFFQHLRIVLTFFDFLNSSIT